MSDVTGYHPKSPHMGPPPKRPNPRTITLSDEQCAEIVDVGNEELRQAKRRVRELLYGRSEDDLDEDEREDLADACEQIVIWTGILDVIGST